MFSAFSEPLKSAAPLEFLEFLESLKSAALLDFSDFSDHIKREFLKLSARARERDTNKTQQDAEFAEPVKRDDQGFLYVFLNLSAREGMGCECLGGVVGVVRVKSKTK